AAPTVRRLALDYSVAGNRRERMTKITKPLDWARRFRTTPASVRAEYHPYHVPEQARRRIATRTDEWREATSRDKPSLSTPAPPAGHRCGRVRPRRAVLLHRAVLDHRLVVPVLREPLDAARGARGRPLRGRRPQRPGPGRDPRRPMRGGAREDPPAVVGALRARVVDHHLQDDRRGRQRRDARARLLRRRQTADHPAGG